MALFLSSNGPRGFSAFSPSSAWLINESSLLLRLPSSIFLLVVVSTVRVRVELVSGMERREYDVFDDGKRI